MPIHIRLSSVVNILAAIRARYWAVLLLIATPRYTGPMLEYIQVVTTTGKREDAERIAQALVEERLAACVQLIGPITSIYRWKDQVETAEEWQCWAKSRRELYEAIERAIHRLHPYEVPEVLALPVAAGSAGYFAWLDKEVKPGNEEPGTTD